MGVMSYQKIFGLYGLEGHIVEKMWDATPVRNERTNERKKIGQYSAGQNPQLHIFDIWKRYRKDCFCVAQN